MAAARAGGFARAPVLGDRSRGWRPRYCGGMTGRLLAAAALVGTLAGASTAAAFPALYVARHDRAMGHTAASVVLLRDGSRTVVTLQLDYRGPAEDFALVIPVPGPLLAEDVRVLDKRLLDRLDGVTAPRLLERWEQDPCLARAQQQAREPAAMTGRPPPPPTYQDGEYSVMAPGAEESADIVGFLRARKYHLGAAAEAALRPYADLGMRFLIAEVDRQQVHFNSDGEASLSPLRYHHDSEHMILPLKVGASQALGVQELVVHVIAIGRRLEAASYPAELMPTSVALRSEARDRIGPVHAALFDAAHARSPTALFTEYAAWARDCEPCVGGGLSNAELWALGVDAAPGAAALQDPGEGLVITRLHARLAPDEITQDLELRSARPLVGGTDEHPQPGPAPVADPALDGRDQFQTRYLINHTWAGSLECADPLRGVWGPGPGGEQPEPRFVRGLSSVDRTLALPEVLAQDLPALGITARRCGCDVDGPASPVWLLAGLLLRRRRRAAT